MLSINVGGEWTPSKIAYQGKYSYSVSLGNNDVNAAIKPVAATIGTINNATSKTLIVPWTGATGANSGVADETDANAPYSPSAAAPVSIGQSVNYVAKNNTTGELADTGTTASWTDGSLASSTTYSYTVYSGNAAYSLSTSNYSNGTASSAKSATTKTDSVRTTKTWTCAWSESYGSDWTKKNVPEIFHGYVSSNWGNQNGLFGFNIGSQIPSNATIHSVKLYLKATWWYNHAAGGTCTLYLIGGNGYQTEPPGQPTGSAVSSTTLDYTDVGEAGKWNTLPVDFGNDLRGFGNRVFWVKGPDNSNDHYGYFAGNGQTGEPQLQIDYTYYT